MYGYPQPSSFPYPGAYSLPLQTSPYQSASFPAHFSQPYSPTPVFFSQQPYANSGPTYSQQTQLHQHQQTFHPVQQQYPSHPPQPLLHAPTPIKDVEIASEQDEAVAEEKKRLSQLAAVKKKMAVRPKVAAQRSTTSTQSKPGVAKQAVELFKLDSSDEEQETDMSRFHGKTKSSLQSVKPQIPEVFKEPQAASDPSMVAAVAGPPSDPETLTAIHNLAAFVNKQGEQFEAMVKQRNEAKFRFLEEPQSEAYRYYRQCLQELTQPAAAPLPIADSDDEDEHSLVGKTVEVLGVQSKPELNGQRGLVESFNDDTGRYVVKLRDVSIALKPANMKRVDPNDPTYVPPILAGSSVPQLPPIKPIMSKQKAAAAAVITRLNAKLPSSPPSCSESSRGSKWSDSGTKPSKWSDASGVPTNSESTKRSRWSTGISSTATVVTQSQSSTLPPVTVEERIENFKFPTNAEQLKPSKSSTSSLDLPDSHLSENLKQSYAANVPEAQKAPSFPLSEASDNAPGVRILAPLTVKQESSDEEGLHAQDSYSPASERFSEVKSTRKRRSRFDEMPSVPTPDLDGVPLLGTKASGYADSLSQMNAYFNQVCETEKNKLGNEMESIREGGEKHHIGDYLPKDALAKFNAKITGNEVVDNTNKLTAQNKGYGLLAKMGWTEGAGLGKNSTGIANPIQAGGGVAGAGIGANRDHVELTPGDDAFGAYKKKMALSYRFRPNPLGNPRKAYWEDTGMNAGATQKLSAVAESSAAPNIN